MARQPRLDIASVSQHIVQRGNNRLPCFLNDSDRLHYLQLLREALIFTECAVHAYVLMDNHVHLLVTPPRVGAVSQLMQMLGRGYVGAFNARHGRTGTLWEGRYKSCLVDGDAHLLECIRYIDLNPVRAGLTDDPAAYRWSSCRANTGDRIDVVLEQHQCYLALGSTAETRAAAYRSILREAVPDTRLTEIRLYLQQQRALGRDAFRTMVEAKTQRFAGTRPAHRPPNTQPRSRIEPDLVSDPKK